MYKIILTLNIDHMKSFHILHNIYIYIYIAIFQQKIKIILKFVCSFYIFQILSTIILKIISKKC